MRLVGFEEGVEGDDVGGIAMRLEHQHRGFEFVDAQMKDRVIELACDLQRPERWPLPDHDVDIGRGCCFRRLDRNSRYALRTVDIDTDKTVADAGVINGPLQRRKRNALAVA